MTLESDCQKAFAKCKVVLLDVAGTTTSLKFVKETLYSYVSENVETFLKEKWDSEDVKIALKLLNNDQDVNDSDAAVKLVRDSAEKHSENIGLKALCGLVYMKGYEDGDLKAHVYSDVPLAFTTWSKDRKIAIYSTGSVESQKLLFKHSTEGDLTSNVSHYFDQSVGPKTSSGSYTTIIKSLNVAADEVLWISDIKQELEAAKEAGLLTILINRESKDETSDFLKITSFAELVVDTSANKRKNEDDDNESKNERPSKISKQVSENINGNEESTTIASKTDGVSESESKLMCNGLHELVELPKDEAREVKLNESAETASAVEMDVDPPETDVIGAINAVGCSEKVTDNVIEKMETDQVNEQMKTDLHNSVDEPEIQVESTKPRNCEQSPNEKTENTTPETVVIVIEPEAELENSAECEKKITDKIEDAVVSTTNAEQEEVVENAKINQDHASYGNAETIKPIATNVEKEIATEDPIVIEETKKDHKVTADTNKEHPDIFEEIGQESSENAKALSVVHSNSEMQIKSDTETGKESKILPMELVEKLVPETSLDVKDTNDAPCTTEIDTPKGDNVRDDDVHTMTIINTSTCSTVIKNDDNSAPDVEKCNNIKSNEEVLTVQETSVPNSNEALPAVMKTDSAKLDVQMQEMDLPKCDVATSSDTQIDARTCGCNKSNDTAVSTEIDVPSCGDHKSIDITPAVMEIDKIGEDIAPAAMEIDKIKGEDITPAVTEIDKIKGDDAEVAVIEIDISKCDDHKSNDIVLNVSEIEVSKCDGGESDKVAYAVVEIDVPKCDDVASEVMEFDVPKCDDVASEAIELDISKSDNIKNDNVAVAVTEIEISRCDDIKLDDVPTAMETSTPARDDSNEMDVVCAAENKETSNIVNSICKLENVTWSPSLNNALALVDVLEDTKTIEVGKSTTEVAEKTSAAILMEPKTNESTIDTCTLPTVDHSVVDATVTQEINESVSVQKRNESGLEVVDKIAANLEPEKVELDNGAEIASTVDNMQNGNKTNGTHDVEDDLAKMVTNGQETESQDEVIIKKVDTNTESATLSIEA